MTDDWPTPKWLMQYFKNFYDPCPLNGTDGLIKPWGSPSFINPPFSKISEFVEFSLLQPKPQVWFVPFRPDTAWFQKLIENGGQACYFTNRLYRGSNFASCLIFVDDEDW